MSHFAVLVLGENVKEQLEPFWELDLSEDEIKQDPRAEFIDKTEETIREYNTKTCREFYCASSSSWGHQIDKRLFHKIKRCPVGRQMDISVTKKEMGSYLRAKEKYKGYYTTPTGKRCKKDAWFEVVEVLETTHPDKDVCFEGKVKIKVIEPPKDIPLKDKYESIEVFAKEWNGYIKNGKKYGYYSNPKAKWDWFQIGGRYRDRLALKDGASGKKGEGLEKYVGSLYQESTPGYVDSAKKGDINWEKIHKTKREYDNAIRFWEMKVEGAEPTTEEEKEQLKWDWYKDGYYEDRYKNKETYATCMSNFTMWAIIKDGEWIEKGDMGWFGVSGESHDEAVKWELNFYDTFIKDLPDNTLITVVDCHI